MKKVSKAQLSLATTFVGTAGISSIQSIVILDGTLERVGLSVSRIVILWLQVSVKVTSWFESPQQPYTENSSSSHIFSLSSDLS